MSKSVRLSRVFKTAVVAAAVMALVGCSSPEEKVANYIEDGQTYLKEGDLIRARIEFQNALQINPNKIEAIMALADIAERSGDWQRVFGLLTKAVEVDEKNLDAHLRLGKLMVSANELDKAMASVKAAEALAPNSADVMALKAALLFKLDDRPAAVELANKALSIDAKNQDALVVLATERMLSDDPAAAVQYMDRGLAGDEKNVALQLIKVQALERLAQFDNAEEVFRKLIAFYPENPAFRRTLAYFYLSHKQPEKAEAELRAVAKANPKNAKAQLEVVQFLGGTKGPEAALAELKRVVEADPDNLEYRFALAELHTANKRTADARKVYQDVIDQADDEADGTRARAAMARLALAEGKRAEADKLIAEVLERDGRNEDGLLLKAGLELEAGRREEAIGHLRTILRDIPDSPRAHLLLARTHEVQGAKDLAMDHYGRAWSAGKQAGQFGLPYAEYLIRNGRANQAPDVLKAVLGKEPRNLDAMKLLARAYINSGDLAAAQALADQMAKMDDQAGTASLIQAAVFEARQNYDSSIAAFRKAYESTPTEVQPLVALVNSYLRAGKNREAQAFVQSVLASSPNNTAARLLLGQLQTNAGELDAAVATFEDVLKQDAKSTDAFQGIVNARVRQQRPDEALKAVDRGLAALPGDVGLRISRAGIFESQNRFDDAIAVYDQLLKERPNSEIVANNLASLLADHRTDKPSLERAYQSAQRFKSSDVPYFMDTYGWASHRVGRNEEAVVVLKRAIEKMPDLAAIHYHYGMVQLSLNNKALAREALSKAIELGKTQSFPQMAAAQKALQGI